MVARLTVDADVSESASNESAVNTCSAFGNRRQSSDHIFSTQAHFLTNMLIISGYVRPRPICTSDIRVGYAAAAAHSNNNNTAGRIICTSGKLARPPLANVQPSDCMLLGWSLRVYRQPGRFSNKDC